MSDDDEYMPYRIVARALEHFAQRLDNMKSDDVVKVGNSMIVKDLEANAESIRSLRTRFLGNRENNTNLFDYNIEVICLSLTRYHKDLVDSQKALHDKLTDGKQDIPGFELKFLKKEIDVVSGLEQHFCKPLHK